MPQLPGGQFNPADYGDMKDFTPVPPGKYIAKITSSELKDTSTNGKMLVLTADIVAGPFTGKQYVTRLNLVNASPTAVRIANEELATLSRACGFNVPIQTSEQLHNIAHVVTLKLEPGTKKYPPKNEPSMYSSAAGLTEAPVNPEPDEATLAIINGTSKVDDDGGAVGGPAAAPPPAPDGFATPPPPPQQQGATTAPPPPTGEAPAAAPAPAPTQGGAPPW